LTYQLLQSQGNRSQRALASHNQKQLKLKLRSVISQETKSEVGWAQLNNIEQNKNGAEILSAPLLFVN
jgi:transcription termination factor Rho